MQQKKLKVARAIRRLTPMDWSSIRFKIGLGLVWPLAFAGGSPDSIVHVLGWPFLVMWLGCTIVGMCVSVSGLIMSAQTGMMRLRGFRIEMAGLCIFGAGPFVYMAAQVGFITAEFSFLRLAQICLAYALTEAVINRFLTVKARATLELGKTGE